MKYQVTIRENYEKVLTIEADSKEEASDEVNGMDTLMCPDNYVKDSYHIVKIKEIKNEL